MGEHESRALSRRTMLGGSAALAGLLACRTGAGAQDATPGATPGAASGIQPDGTWAFTDDRGITVTLPKMPERVVADINAAGCLWDFGIRPVGIFGWNITGEKEFNAAGGNVDPEAVEFLSAPSSDMIDVEKLALIKPDLIVSLSYAPQYGVWSINPDIQDEVESLAPIVCISGIIRADESLAHFADLAGSLGVDLESAEIQAQKDEYETAVADFEATIAAKAGLSAIFVWADEAELYVANANAAGDVWLFRDLGLAVPDVPVDEGEYWEIVSAEEVIKYPTDVFFYSIRSAITDVERFKEHPTYGAHPAVLADQIYGWNQDFILNYPGMTKILNDLTANLAGADAAVGEL